MKWFVIALAFSLFASSCTTFEPVAIDEAGKQLGPGDQIRVTMVNGDSFSARVSAVMPTGIRVAPDSVRARWNADGGFSEIPAEGLSFLPFEDILSLKEGHEFDFVQSFGYVLLGLAGVAGFVFLVMAGLGSGLASASSGSRPIQKLSRDPSPRWHRA